MIETSMIKTTIRRYVYVAVLTLSVFSVAPALASAQEARGSFTLANEVRWQNAVIPAGTYHFKAIASGPSEMLVLSKISGENAGFMILVNDTREMKEAVAPGKVIVISRDGKDYVSRMELPSIGMTLNFATPVERTELAKATTIAKPGAGK